MDNLSLDQYENSRYNFLQGLQTHSTLRHDENVRYDEKVIEIAHANLTGIADLKNRGLFVNLENIGVSMSYYERVSDMTPAAIDMDAETQSENDAVTYDRIGVPIPIIHKDWRLGLRQLEASRTRGEALDTTQISVASRYVAEALENALFNGVPDLVVDGNSIYGYTNHPNRSSVTLAGSGWSNPTGRDIIGDVQKMLNLAFLSNRSGNFILYVAKNIWTDLLLDYNNSKGSMTYKERIVAMGIDEVKSSPALLNDNVVLVQMQPEVVDLAIAQDFRTDKWSEDRMMTRFKVYGAMAPRVKSDKNGSCGVVHGSI